jgi:hypothetical protein
MMGGLGLFVGWYDTDPAFQPELDRWHSEEHMPERIALPGFRTGQRYKSGSEDWQYCVIYRTADIQTFISESYLNILNKPTQWTRAMMPGVRNLNRSLCSVVRDTGGGFGGLLYTVRFSPARESDNTLQWIDEIVIPGALAEPGIVRVTLAVADATISRTRTNEQVLRSQPDAVSDWVLLIEGYDDAARVRLESGIVSPHSVGEQGGGSQAVCRTFQISHLLISS